MQASTGSGQNTKISQSELPDWAVKGKIKVGRDKRKEEVWDGGEYL